MNQETDMRGSFAPDNTTGADWREHCERESRDAAIDALNSAAARGQMPRGVARRNWVGPLLDSIAFVHRGQPATIRVHGTRHSTVGRRLIVVDAAGEKIADTDDQMDMVDAMQVLDIQLGVP